MKLMYPFSDFQSDVEEVAGLNTAMFRYTQTDYLICVLIIIFPKWELFLNFIQIFFLEGNREENVERLLDQTSGL